MDPLPKARRTDSERKTQLSKIKTKLAGSWNSNIGVVYIIKQTGNEFTWWVEQLKQEAKGKIEGKAVTASWKDKKGNIIVVEASGMAGGTLLAVDGVIDLKVLDIAV